MHVGVPCRGVGGGGLEKNPPDFLVYFTAAEIPKSSFAPSSCLPTSHPKAVSQQNFQVLWQLLQKSQRKETVTGAGELGEEKGSGRQSGMLGRAQQDDRTLKTRGKRGEGGDGGCGVILGAPRNGPHSPRPRYVLCAGGTSTVRKRRWPTSRWVAPKVKNAPPPQPRPRPPTRPRSHQAEMWQHVLACRSSGTLGLLFEGPARVGWH